MKSAKSSQRTRLNDQHSPSLIKIGTAHTFEPDIPKIVSKRGVKPKDKALKVIEYFRINVQFLTAVICVQCICCCYKLQELHYCVFTNAA